VLGYQTNSYNVTLTPQEDTAASPKHRRTKTTHGGEKKELMHRSYHGRSMWLFKINYIIAHWWFNYLDPLALMITN
jgi:hypothetical protein